jgi:branched-chain amino acid transport system permease protein
VLHDLPSRIGLDFDLSEISAGIYGFLLVLIMLVRPQGLLPARRRPARSAARA